MSTVCQDTAAHSGLCLCGISYSCKWPLGTACYSYYGDGIKAEILFSESGESPRPMITRFHTHGELLVKADQAETRFKNMGIMSAYKAPENSYVV